MLDEAATVYADKLKFAKLNVDENQRIAVKFHIRSIPTLLLFKNGVTVAQKVGAVSKSALAAWLDAQLQPAQSAEAR